MDRRCGPDGGAERAPDAALGHDEVTLQRADGERGVPAHELEDVATVGVYGDAEVVGEDAAVVERCKRWVEHREPPEQEAFEA
jgi:hypothetical protein